ncbi:MAG: hypothetical protein KGK30_01890, partial [Elusimicrobia bacterium]|nr:hypothetical protein [Elusimicrobiota bacterium]
MNRLLPLALAALLAAPALADKNIVVVNGTPIRQSEVLDRLWKRYGNDTVDEMIDELLLRQAAARSRIEVSAAEVNRRFARIRSQFSDPKVFAAQLAGAGTTVEALK